MVDKSMLPIIWDKEAKKQLKEAYDKLLEDTFKGAVTVRDGKLDAVEQIPEQPHKYPTDKFKNNNAGNYRAFELHNYRIAYKITDENTQILRIRHTKREPLNH
jgi:mRNA-degrading endonuclease RelE of RelBE toxin-antitoxin system